MDEYIIIFQEIIAAIALLFAMVTLVFRYKKNKRMSQLILALAMFPLFLSAFVNILEYLVDFKTAEDFEDFIALLFLPILIFSIHTSLLNTELEKRNQSETKFKGLFNQSFSFMGLLNAKGELLEANETAMKIVEDDEYNPIGQPFDKTYWWHHSEEEQEKVRKAIEEARKGKTIRFESTHSTKDNQLLHFDVTFKPIMDNDGKLLYIIPEGREISEIKDARLELERHKANLELIVNERTKALISANREVGVVNEKLQKKNAELEEIISQLKVAQQQVIDSEKMASLGVLTAGVAHEINNPLNFILGACTALESIMEDNQLMDSNIPMLLKHIKTGVDKASTIVSSLNQFSRNVDGCNELVDIHAVIDDCLVMINYRLKNNIRIIKEFASNQLIALGNVGKMHQVFMNIFLNACQAINGKGTITIKTYREEKNIIIDIADTGIGIAEENLNKVIAPFFTTKAPGEGTGLGMAITYNIIKQHDGMLEITSNFGAGTNIRIKLPYFNKVNQVK